MTSYFRQSMTNEADVNSQSPDRDPLSGLPAEGVGRSPYQGVSAPERSQGDPPPKNRGSKERDELTDDLAGAYSLLQLVIGILAIALPVVVTVGDWLFEDRSWLTFRGSISAYYYARTGGWLVGTLSVTGFFFLSYKHRWSPTEKTDFISTKVAALAAVGVALFPTTSEGSPGNVVGSVHYFAALILFGILAFLVIHSFTKARGHADQGWRKELRRLWGDTAEVKATMAEGKLKRNRLYRYSGFAMVATLIGSLMYSLADSRWPSSGFLFLPDFWFFFAESFVIVLFGFIWLLKSQRVPLLPKDDLNGQN